MKPMGWEIRPLGWLMLLLIMGVLAYWIFCRLQRPPAESERLT